MKLVKTTKHTEKQRKRTTKLNSWCPICQSNIIWHLFTQLSANEHFSALLNMDIVSGHHFQID